MLTIYLVRDTKSNPASYLTFVTNDDDEVLIQTATRSIKYSDAVLCASILFKLFYELAPDVEDHIASYIESPYESARITSYSEGEFCAKKTSEHYVYAKLIDHYQSLLTRVSSSDALRIIRREHNLTAEQRVKLVDFLKMKPKE